MFLLKLSTWMFKIFLFFKKNDDESEIQEGRNNITDNSSDSIRFARPSGIIDDNEDLKNCLELFQHNVSL